MALPIFFLPCVCLVYAAECALCPPVVGRVAREAAGPARDEPDAGDEQDDRDVRPVGGEKDHVFHKGWKNV
jgi:hypothetical protein